MAEELKILLRDMVVGAAAGFIFFYYIFMSCGAMLWAITLPNR